MAKKNNRQRSKAPAKREPAAEASEIAAELTTSQRPAKLSRSQAAAERIEEEYAYITNDLRRVFILAAAMFALLIALNVIFRLAG
ncbi:MAG TPA: hypothetical protein VF434_09070 [Promineifilum sp.]